VWLSVDRLAKEFHSLSPYNFVENNPLMLFDADGNSPQWWPGITLFYKNKEISGGLGVGYINMKQEGYAKDEVGYTVFRMTSLGRVDASDGTPEVVGGAGFSTTIGVEQVFSRETFWALALFDDDASEFAFDFGAGSSIDFGFGTNGSISLGVGVGVSARVSISNSTIEYSLSMTYAENAELIKKHGDNLNFEIGEVSRNSDGVYTSTMKITKNDRAFNTRINLVSPNGKIWFTSNYVDAAKNVEEL
jgi:hypothetical protein